MTTGREGPIGLALANVQRNNNSVNIKTLNDNIVQIKNEKVPSGRTIISVMAYARLLGIRMTLGYPRSEFK